MTQYEQATVGGQGLRGIEIRRQRAGPHSNSSPAFSPLWTFQFILLEHESLIKWCRNVGGGVLQFVSFSS